MTFFLNLIIFIFSFTSEIAFLLDIFVEPRSLFCHIHKYLTFLFLQINILTFYTLVFSQYDFVDQSIGQGTRCLSELVGNASMWHASNFIYPQALLSKCIYVKFGLHVLLHVAIFFSTIKSLFWYKSRHYLETVYFIHTSDEVIL